MLVGNLPFGKELSQCPRFQRFRRWAADQDSSGIENPTKTSYPSWLFPQNTSHTARLLIVGLLHPEPSRRMSIDSALKHPWFSVGYEADPLVHSLIKSFKNLETPSKQQGALLQRAGGEKSAQVGLKDPVTESPPRIWN